MILPSTVFVLKDSQSVEKAFLVLTEFKRNFFWFLVDGADFRSFLMDKLYFNRFSTNEVQFLGFLMNDVTFQ